LDGTGSAEQVYAAVQKKERKDNLNEQVNLPGVKRTVYFGKSVKSSSLKKLEEAIVTSFLYPNAKYPCRVT